MTATASSRRIWNGLAGIGGAMFVTVAASSSAAPVPAPVSWHVPTAPIFKITTSPTLSFASRSTGTGEIAFVAPGRIAGTEGVYVLSQHAVGAGFGPARELDLPLAQAAGPAPGLDGAGNVMIAYVLAQTPTGSQAGAGAVYVRIAPARGVFGPPIDVSGSANGLHPALAEASDGAAVLTFEQLKGSATLMAATRPPGGSFSAPVAVSGMTSGPAMAVDSAGEIVIASPQARGIAVVTGTVSGGLGATQSLGSAGADNPSVAVGDGRAVVSWTYLKNANAGSFKCSAALGPLGHPFSQPVMLSERCGGQEVALPAVAVTSDGDAIVAVANATKSRRTTATRLMTYAAAPGQGFGAHRLVYRGSDLVPPLVLASGTHGDAVLAFEDIGSSPRSPDFDVIHAAVSTSRGVFGAAPAISHQPPALGLDAAGVGPRGELDVIWDSAQGIWVGGAAER